MTSTVATQAVPALLQKKIVEAAELASEYLIIAKASEEQMSALASRQESAILGMGVSHDMVDYHSFFPRAGYHRSHLKFEDYYTDTVNKFLDLVSNLISRTYSVDFSFNNRALLVALFLEDGISLDPIYDAISLYQDGGSFEDVKKREVTEAFALLVEENRSWAKESDMRIIVKGTEIIFPNLAHENWAGDNKIDYSTEAHLATIRNYVEVVLGENLTFGRSIPVGFGAPFIPEKTLQSSITRLSVFKNGNLKVQFKSGAAVDAFLAPARKHLGLK